MQTPDRTELAILADEHLQKLSGERRMKDDDAVDEVKLPRAVRKVVDTSFGRPDRPWHEWDEWQLGL